MNVRFADGEIRFRISPAELDSLLSGRKLSLSLRLPQHRRLEITLRTSPTLWGLASDPTGLWVSVPIPAVTAFAATLPAKTGLEHEFPIDDKAGTLRLRMEVDVKRRNTPR